MTLLKRKTDYQERPDNLYEDIADDKGGKKEWWMDFIVTVFFVVGVVGALVFVFG